MSNNSPSNNPTQKSQWRALTDHANDIKKTSLNDLFTQDTKRARTLSTEINDIYFDYSKQHLTQQTIDHLCDLLTACDFDTKRRAMFEGDIINVTEKRAVLHTALRRPKTDTINVNNENVLPNIHHTLNRIKTLTDDVRNGRFLGTTGKPIKKVISIGIGGSDLGPRMICKALEEENQPLDVQFVANIDGDDLEKALHGANPEETLFLVISKSFTTQETLINAQSARTWFMTHCPGGDIAKHFIAVSSNIEAVKTFGIDADNIFPMWDWVNGRFSLWSAVGLSIAFQNGFDVFRALLDGAHDMDQHFLNTDLDQNIPVLMALIGIWNRNFLNYDQLAILPYSQRLGYLPFYLQQLEMESNGKSVDLDNAPITDYKTNPSLFGEVGTNGQHSFYQLLHQGSNIIPCDFIGAVKPNNDLTNHHTLLLSNMLAQSQALMQGQEIEGDPHRYFAGNRPSTTILLKTLNPHTVGQLIALYEHKCFTQGVIWNVNSFDQFGVELGKDLARKLEKNDLTTADPSTKELYTRIHK